MERRILALSLASAVLAGCTWPSAPTGDDAASSSSAGAMTDQSSSAMMDDDDAMMDDDSKSSDAMMDDDGAMMQSSAAAMVTASADAMVAANGIYTPYHDGVIGNGETSVLFFHASWCPTCKQANSALLQWYGAGSVPLTVYKVDYDTQTELKSRYGITSQHTFVKIDGEGNVISRLTGPSNAQLKALIGA